MTEDRLKDSKVRVTIVLKKEMRDEVDKQAEKADRTRSKYIELILRDHLNKQSKPDKQ
jgi:metal-responsive CopG/Arc/MetJ family transcriptional regulator